jgi:hypothetical protein
LLVINYFQAPSNPWLAAHRLDGKTDKTTAKSHGMGGQQDVLGG